MSFYFTKLCEKSAKVLMKEIKQRAHEVKVNWSFNWFEYIKNHSDMPWDYDNMCANSNLTWEIIQAYPVLFNDYYNLCTNPNITTLSACTTC